PETRGVGRLTSTWVAARPSPQSSTITSGVSPTHQFGGSTFVTAGAVSLAVCCGRARSAEPPQAYATTDRKEKKARRNRSAAKYQKWRSRIRLRRLGDRKSTR